jgi:hypothetical protein
MEGRLTKSTEASTGNYMHHTKRQKIYHLRRIQNVTKGRKVGEGYRFKPPII